MKSSVAVLNTLYSHLVHTRMNTHTHTRHWVEHSLAFLLPPRAFNLSACLYFSRFLLLSVSTSGISWTDIRPEHRLTFVSSAQFPSLHLVGRIRALMWSVDDVYNLVARHPTARARVH